MRNMVIPLRAVLGLGKGKDKGIRVRTKTRQPQDDKITRQDNTRQHETRQHTQPQENHNTTKRQDKTKQDKTKGKKTGKFTQMRPLFPRPRTEDVSAFFDCVCSNTSKPKNDDRKLPPALFTGRTFVYYTRNIFDK